MNLDDKSLFLDAMEDVQPLKRNDDVHWHPGITAGPRNASIPCSWIIFTTGYLDIVPLATPLELSERAAERRAG